MRANGEKNLFSFLLFCQSNVNRNIRIGDKRTETAGWVNVSVSIVNNNNNYMFRALIMARSQAISLDKEVNAYQWN